MNINIISGFIEEAYLKEGEIIEQELISFAEYRGYSIDELAKKCRKNVINEITGGKIKTIETYESNFTKSDWKFIWF